MAIKRALSCIFLLFLLGIYAKAQSLKSPTTSILFEDFNGYLNASQLQSKEGIQIGSNNRMGAFSEIREIYAFGSHNLGKKKNQGIGLALYSEQEGKLIADNRLKASYWKSLKLNNTLKLVAGAQVGLINTSLKATRSTPGANTWSPDIDFGFTLKSDYSSLGVSINQIGNQIIKPLTQEIRISRFYTILAQHKVILNQDYSMKLIAHTHILKDVESPYQLKAEFAYQENINAGIGIGNNGLLFTVGFETDQIIKNKISLKIGYQNPVTTTLPSAYQASQVHFGYFFN